jgi:hypothetical protein
MRPAKSGYNADMVRRWFIRGFFVGLLLSCLAAWWASGYYSATVDYFQDGRFGVGGESMAGIVRFGGGIGVEYYCPSGFSGHVARSSPPGFMALRWDEPKDYYFGFSVFSGHSTTTGTVFGISVPYWFISLVLAVLLWLVWRKTRPKPKGGAFPVEIRQGVRS